MTLGIFLVSTVAQNERISLSALITCLRCPGALWACVCVPIMTVSCYSSRCSLCSQGQKIKRQLLQTFPECVVENPVPSAQVAKC